MDLRLGSSRSMVILPFYRHEELTDWICPFWDYVIPRRHCACLERLLDALIVSSSAGLDEARGFPFLTSSRLAAAATSLSLHLQY